ncbi:hypothetical protein FHN55_20215 [Streptomyces sp. NP160]|uniref:hypothetical protein n=1 Tax=Streptomyces sp. NP160 TaxID=2586637 RepID=UPI001117B29F|nr:hypothetical protein [Streptomyces sp. NP160]TNM59686.1 hypothetical protein FHN55_20215 [Streptomyces sp. NP160]
MSLLDTDMVFTSAVHPAVVASQRPTLDPAWGPAPARGRRADRSRPAAGARSWDDVLRLTGLAALAGRSSRSGRHAAPATTHLLGTITTVRAQQELRAS